MKISYILIFSLLIISTFASFEKYTHLVAYSEEQDEHEQPLTFSKKDIATFITASILIMIAAGGGIGGGGVLVPTYIFVLGFRPQYAIPLSNATILGSSIANLLFNVGKRHPIADRPRIDWDIMLVMEPLTVAGALVGSFINVLSPPWLICCLLVCLLSATTVKSFKKGIKMYNKESAAFAQAEGLSSNDGESGNMLAKKLIINDSSNACGADLIDEARKTGNNTLANILETESTTPWWKVRMMFYVTGGMLTLTILKGGGNVNPIGVVCGTWQYWAITLAALPYVLIISIIARNHLVSVWQQKKQCNFQYVEGDVEWNPRNTIVYPLICSIAGLCAGMFGIGGGIVKGPLMLEMGVLPEVTSATSATMILFTSAAATVSYLLFESLNLQYGIMVFTLGFLNTLVGQKVLNKVVKYYGRSSIIVLLIATIVGLSSIAMSLESSGTLLDFINGVPQPSPTLCGGSSAA